MITLLAAISLGNPADVGLPQTSLDVLLKNIFATVFYVAGALAVILVIYSGLTYSLSAGNPQNIKRAKDTLLAAIVGLVIAISAEAIVQYILSKVK